MWSVILLKNRSQKIAAAFALALTLSFALLGTVTVLLTDAALHRQVDQKIMAEMNRLVTIEKTSGLGALAKVQTKFESSEQSLLFRFEDKKQNLVIGNFSQHTLQLGWADVSIEPVDAQEQQDRFRVFTQVLGQGELSVASDIDEIENIKDTLTGAFITAGLVASCLASISAMWFGHFNAKSINQLAATAEAIAGGDVEQRMLTSHGEEGFDRLSATLNTMLDRNLELLESQRRVTSEIAHDIRTPLTRLRQILEKDGNAAALKEADRLLDIFNSLLRIAELEEGARTAAFSKVDLSKLVAEVVDAYANNFEDLGRSIVLSAAPAIWIQGDKTLLMQLISNLLENVLAHTPDGTEARFAVVANLEQIELSVTDNGTGVADDDVKNIFKRFYRSQKSRTSQGNGLGLALVAAIAHLHGAEVGAENLNPGLKIRVVWKNACG
jgi:signal transduction histidine kinase